MAQRMRADMEERTVVVDRTELINQLKANKEKHIKDYNEAMAGYKAVLLEKTNEAFDKAKGVLEEKRRKMVEKVSSLTDEDISRQQDRIVLLDAICVDMKVPRSYAAEYEAAIEMAIWDERPTLELTRAEFTCFIRDMWDWKDGFEAVSAIYKAMVVK